MPYSKEDPVEIILGVCDHCNSYVPFIRLVTKEDQRVYQCMTCKSKHKQYVNGKVTFNYLEEGFSIKRN